MVSLSAHLDRRITSSIGQDRRIAARDRRRVRTCASSLIVGFANERTRLLAFVGFVTARQNMQKKYIYTVFL
jgi:hypothetical protein